MPGHGLWPVPRVGIPRVQVSSNPNMLGHGHWPAPMNMLRGSDQSSSALTQTIPTTTVLLPVVRPGSPGCPHGHTRVITISENYRLRCCMMLMTDVAGCCRCLLIQIDFELSAEWGHTSGQSTLKVLHWLLVNLFLLVVSLPLLCCSFVVAVGCWC